MLSPIPARPASSVLGEQLHMEVCLGKDGKLLLLKQVTHKANAVTHPALLGAGGAGFPGSLATCLTQSVLLQSLRTGGL